MRCTACNSPYLPSSKDTGICNKCRDITNRAIRQKDDHIFHGIQEGETPPTNESDYAKYTYPSKENLMDA